MTPKTISRLERFLALAEKAQPGPWFLDEPDTTRWGVTAKNIMAKGEKLETEVVHADDFYLDGNREDFDFILSSRTEGPWAAREIEEAIEFIGSYRCTCLPDVDGDCPGCDFLTRLEDEQ